MRSKLMMQMHYENFEIIFKRYHKRNKVVKFFENIQRNFIQKQLESIYFSFLFVKNYVNSRLSH